MQPVLVLFDIDGTLLHSGGCGRAATRLALEKVYGTCGSADTISFAGKTDWQIVQESLTPAGIGLEAVRDGLDHYIETVARVLQEIVSQYPVQPCPGAREVVAALAADPSAVIGLVTGNMPSLVPIKLRAAGFNPDDFKIGAFGSEGWIRSMLPPVALDRAKMYCGIDFKPNQVVIIGDTPGDIECATSIQARTIAVATGPFSVSQLRAHNPTHVFESMADQEAFLAAVRQNGH